MNRWQIGGVVGLVVSGVVACVAAANFGAVTYGAAEVTPQVNAVVNGGWLTALLGAAGSVFAFFRGSSSTIIDHGKQIIGDIAGGNASAITVDAAFVTIAATILAAKGDIDPQLLADLGTLRKKVVEVVK